MTDSTKAVWAKPTEDGRWLTIMFAIHHNTGAAEILDVVEAADIVAIGVRTQLEMHPDCNAVMVPAWAPSAEPCGNHYVWSSDMLSVEELVELQTVLETGPPAEEDPVSVPELVVTQLQSHEDGLGDLSVWVATVYYHDGYGNHRRMLVIRDETARRAGAKDCLIFDIERLAAGDIYVSKDTCCGVYFSSVVDQAITARLAEGT